MITHAEWERRLKQVHRLNAIAAKMFADRPLTVARDRQFLA
jgi:hypothetical protein